MENTNMVDVTVHTDNFRAWCCVEIGFNVTVLHMVDILIGYIANIYHHRSSLMLFILLIKCSDELMIDSERSNEQKNHRMGLLAHAPGMPGTFSPSPTSKETAR